MTVQAIEQGLQKSDFQQMAACRRAEAGVLGRVVEFDNADEPMSWLTDT